MGDFALQTVFEFRSLLMSIVNGQVNELYSSVGTHPACNGVNVLRFQRFISYNYLIFSPHHK